MLRRIGAGLLGMSIVVLQSLTPALAAPPAAAAPVKPCKIPRSSEKPSSFAKPHEGSSGTATGLDELVLPGRPDPDYVPRALLPAKAPSNKSLILPHPPQDPAKLVVANGAGTAAVIHALAEHGDFKELRQLWDGPWATAAGRQGSPDRVRGSVPASVRARATMLMAPGVQRELKVRHVPGDDPVTVRVEGGPHVPGADPVGDELFDNMGGVVSMFETLGRKPTTKVTAVLKDNSTDASNDQHNVLQIGRGDGASSRDWAEAAVVGHEFTHTVVRETANFGKGGQPGALNEHFSDVLGICYAHWKNVTTVQDSIWEHGVEAIPFVAKDKKPTRSMRKPSSVGNQPEHMSQFVQGDYAAYKNVGIPNRAFYGAAMRIGGYSWQSAGKIWYVALRDYMRPDSTFRDAARATVQVAGEIYGPGSHEQRAVLAGWNDVGIIVRPTDPPLLPRTPTP
jgi:hypothetical protein